jgi:hypothetical protein
MSATERRQLSEMRDVVTVWKAPSRSGRGVHVKESCAQLQQASTIFEKDASLFPDDTPVCQFCIEPGGSPGATCPLCDEQVGGHLHKHFQEAHNGE